MINYSKKEKMLDIKLSDTLYQNDRIIFLKMILLVQLLNYIKIID